MASRLQVGPLHRFKPGETLACPLFIAKVPAGFPSPADDYIEQWLDLNDYLVLHPAATFFARVSGDSMNDVGIHDGDVLVIDRAIEPRDGQIVIALLDGEYTVKRIRRIKNRLYLVAENADYPALEIHSHHQFEVWGVVTYVIHPL
ncbi:MAG: translesion error-prone DNA polymerase V autoproteolytic subunit [Armatimonadetes bacterium]|nr:translesion error-prone DNA polymerase V autoproteolytic subunit [Armatimonadota bacterium]